MLKLLRDTIHGDGFPALLRIRTSKAIIANVEGVGKHVACRSNPRQRYLTPSCLSVVLLAAGPEVSLPENRILLVEDEPTTRELVTYVLREAGYALDAVGSAGAATTCLETVSYALVIVDWFLPDGNGAEVADAAAERGSKTLVISDFVFQIPGRAARGHQLLSKRLASAEIVGAVHRMIGKPVGPERPQV